MNQDFNKVFKTPKYTGVTLSLLSMFVLAAMFVVWQKFPQKTGREIRAKFYDHLRSEIKATCGKNLHGI